MKSSTTANTTKTVTAVSRWSTRSAFLGMPRWSSDISGYPPTVFAPAHAPAQCYRSLSWAQVCSESASISARANNVQQANTVPPIRGYKSLCSMAKHH
jgi:hypothetical protein